MIYLATIGAIYNEDQLMLDKDSIMNAHKSERDRGGVINHAPAHDLDARSDRTISCLIISIMIFKI